MTNAASRWHDPFPTVKGGTVKPLPVVVPGMELVLRGIRLKVIKVTACGAVYMRSLDHPDGMTRERWGSLRALQFALDELEQQS